MLKLVACILASDLLACVVTMESVTTDAPFLQVELHYTSLNKGDVFILDEGMTIHCWNGSQCSRTERMKVIMNESPRPRNGI